MSDADRDKWNERYRAGSHDSDAPSPFLVAQANRLPRRGRALDLAGGAGRNALWLAARGLEVTVADIAEQGLAIARQRAERAQLRIHTLEVDLERDGIPKGPWDVIVWALYLERALFAQLPGALAPGGMLVFVQPTVKNLERHERPPRRFLLEQGELGSLLEELDVIELQESWSPDGHHEARALARRPA